LGPVISDAVHTAELAYRASGCWSVWFLFYSLFYSEFYNKL